jgi:GNAT superfamily N-acetyltransferase
MDIAMKIDLTISLAQPDDLPAMINILADDSLGGHGDVWNEANAAQYREAFAQIVTNSEMELLVARQNGVVLGLLQMVFIRGLTDGGSLKASLHSVFVSAQARGQGVGAALVSGAENRARLRNARFITLVSNKKRLDAHRFYRNLGYAQGHEGFKKVL